MNGGSKGDIYFSFNYIDKELKSKIKEGIQVAFKLKSGSKKDEAYQLELL
ncbi:MAG: hypothetical protein ACOCRK_12125 [bacterium]